MPRRTLSQKSFFDPEFVCPGCVQEGTLAWLLARFRSTLFPDWLLVGWRGQGRRGRNAWPAPVLMTLLVLRWSEEGMSRRAACRRARTDAQWRAALGLQMDTQVPDEKTVREFERFMQGHHPQLGLRRYEAFHEHIVYLCKQGGVVGTEAVWAMDSTPMHCFGAVLDTIRLLGDGLRSLGKLWRRLTQASLDVVVSQWRLPLLATKSTKAAFRIDWRDAKARSRVISQLAHGVVRVVGFVRSRLHEVQPQQRKMVLQRCRGLLKVLVDDLEKDERGRYVIARRVSSNRQVSMTDAHARHGRKSKSKRFNGFKVHVLGDVVSGLIASLAVTPGNCHDGRPAPRLVGRAVALFEDIDHVLADTAYGAAGLRRTVRAVHGVNLVSPPPPSHGRRTDTLSKNEFDIDFETTTATCPKGQSTTDSKRVVHGRDPRRRLRFFWKPEQCLGCSLDRRCPKTWRKHAHSITLHPEEEELRAARVQWNKPEVRQAYRTRSQCERLVHRMTRHGARQARAWGLMAARRQAYSIAAVVNLKLLARALAADPSEREAFSRAA